MEQKEAQSFSLQTQIPFSALLYRLEDAQAAKQQQAARKHGVGEDFRYLYWE
ncbi:hypothetical protein [Brevibacillus marinus]|uniref:hypothetical protein n=1 Tax=Brevibacillus marinus TaxID=2496837 RepID=UPI0013DF1056|nr:hypothetical protein [Brevibacillus marinus]